MLSLERMLTTASIMNLISLLSSHYIRWGGVEVGWEGSWRMAELVCFLISPKGLLGPLIR